MRSFFFNSKVLIILVVLLAVCGLNCKQKPSEQADTNIPQPAQPKIEAETKTEAVAKTEAETSTNLVELAAPEEPADGIAVTVNGVDITEAELQKIIQPQLEKMAQQNKQLPPSFAQALEKQIRQQILDELIVVRLLEEKVKETNIVITDEEVTKQVEQIASAQRPPLSVEELKNIAESQGIVFDDWKNEIRKKLGQQKLFISHVPYNINVTEAEAKKYYDENPTQFQTKEQVRASHILITPKTDEAGADPNQEKAKAKAKAEDLLKQIKEGADFAALAKANSSCSSAAQGGDLNFFGKGNMVPPFEKAAFALETGKVSDIVETRFGYHIIKVTDRKGTGTTSFEQAKNDIIQKLTQGKKNELAQEYINSLKAAASIVYPPGKEPAPPVPPARVPRPQ
ncbi:MAG: peptidylprolyl isomerase [Planctomycetes bacterium]|nr:peptidylprolyl isomerase [Planctomycetota bacterium]